MLVNVTPTLKAMEQKNLNVIEQTDSCSIDRMIESLHDTSVFIEIYVNNNYYIINNDGKRDAIRKINGLYENQIVWKLLPMRNNQDDFMNAKKEKLTALLGKRK